MTAATRIDRAIGGAIFGTDPGGYDGARADYPAELYERLDAHAGGLAGKSLFEVGGGTGIASRALAARAPARLVIIEPDPVLAARFAASGYESVESTFETAPLPDHEFDAGAAASSIHWVDPAEAHHRARRLLRPGGSWAIWWNVYRERGIGDAFADALMPRLEGLVMPPSEAADRHYSLDETEHRAELEAAGFESVTFTIWRRERRLSARRMCDLYASFSFVRALPEAERGEVLGMIESLVDRDFAGAAPNVVLTPLYLARA